MREVLVLAEETRERMDGYFVRHNNGGSIPAGS